MDNLSLEVLNKGTGSTVGDAGMGWSGGDMSESVDGVGSGTLAESTCIGDSSHVLIYG